MTDTYRELTHSLIPVGTRVTPDPDQQGPQLELEDSAEHVITDFSHSKPFSINASATLGQVSSKMAACGVRMLFIIDERGLLRGLITLTDLEGEKPILYIQQHGGNRDEILAQDIMTPFDQIEALEHEEAARSTIGDIVETLKAAGRQHMLVKQDLADGSAMITGLISHSRVEKKLGISIELSQKAQSFAELERALG